MGEEIGRQTLLVPLQSTEYWYSDTSKLNSNSRGMSDINIDRDVDDIGIDIGIFRREECQFIHV